MDTTVHKTRPLDVAGQQQRRTGERTVRLRALAFVRWQGRAGAPRADAARRLALSPSTLGRWERLWHGRQLPAQSLGRPRRPMDALQRLDVAQHLEVLGPAIGLTSLRALFPEQARSRLREAQRQFQGRWLEENALYAEELTWTVPGAVWAADFTDPPRPIDGCFRHLLATRDLASYMHLPAMPTRRVDASTVCRVTESLFLAYGPPLLYKSDLGLGSGLFTDLLARWQVIQLLSPARVPRYNGSAEAGNGSLKLHTYYEAVRHGRGDDWTSDDVEAARQQLITTLRPWGAQGPTPLEKWQARKPITLRQRLQFRQAVQDATARVPADLGLAHHKLDHPAVRALVARAAIRRALESLGYLLVQRRRITPPVHSPLRAKIR